jgi:uncharacterized membrane protein
MADGTRATVKARRQARSLCELEDEPMMVGEMMAGFGWLGMGFMGLWMLVPAGLVVGAVWLATTGLAGRDRRRADGDADAILRRRLAAGEIDAEQYAEARTALGLTEET